MKPETCVIEIFQLLSSFSPAKMSDNLTFKGYAVDHANLDEFKVISFEPKRFESFDIDIKIEVCGVCSSDVHTLSGGWGDISVLPLVSGHEVVGKITRIGEKVTEFQVGDRVGFGAQTGACLECSSCKSDNEQYCAEQVDTYNAKFVIPPSLSSLEFFDFLLSRLADTAI